MSISEAVDFVRQAEQHASSGDHADAFRCLQEAIKLLGKQTNDLSAVALLASCYVKLGRLPDAAACYRRAIALDPSVASSHQNLGLALLHMSKFEAAQVAFEQAIALDPAQASHSYAGLALIMLRRSEPADAARLFRKAYECEPETAMGKFNLARACFYDGSLSDAEKALGDAVGIAPNFADAHRLLAQILQQQGRFVEAEAHLWRLIELEPNRGQAYKAITTGRKMNEQDRPLIEQMRSVLQTHKTTPADECALRYALGKTLNDLGEYEAALKEYDAANLIAARVMLEGRPFEKAKLDRAYEHAATVFTKEFFTRHRYLGSESDLPTFIVGMMRSGTTLTEQILSSHPDVGAGGELSFWTKGGLVGLDPSKSSVDERRLRQTQEEYLELLRGLAPGKARVTDKRNSNRYFLGQIHVAFPRAKIIHCKRNPVDNALSIYMTPNSSPVEFSHVRENIVIAYKEYRRLMNYYSTVLPAGSILDVQYEDLVADPEGETRRLIAFLGLEWNEACLRHQDNKRSVNTPSLWQARQPIYTTSVERWKKYEPWLGVFRDLIDS